jgi:DNA gyrase/topoisomerase IV subunit B
MSKYVKLDPREHVLIRPNMYIGNIVEEDLETFIFNIETNKIEKTKIKYIGGLYKIFDEILVNTIDHITRLKEEQTKNVENPMMITKVNMTKVIKIDLNKETGEVSVYNDGDGIDIEKKDEIYIPEMIFGHMMSSSNFDDTQERVIGGQNGIGAKACNIFSRYFRLETIDAKRKLRYEQEFSNNMKDKTVPIISKYTKYPYTKIVYKPDFNKFKNAHGEPVLSLSDDMYKLFVKRIYDMCALTPNTVKIYLNDRLIEIKNFEAYCKMYLTEDIKWNYYEKINEQWEIMVAPSDGFNQVSFVNGIWTIKGGKHVESITKQITKRLLEIAVKKKRKNVENIKEQYIKDSLFVFVNSTIGNPNFDSQSKETLITAMNKFNTKNIISDKLIEKIYKTNFLEDIVATLNIDTDNNKLLKKTDGKKTKNIYVDKLDDANLAGTDKSINCTLILTEGDSAKALAISGLSILGRDTYGVYPLKGKIMNVYDTTPEKILKNTEITALKKILGLETGKKYETLESLRYGRIMIMTDQDSVSGDTPILLRDKNNKMVLKTIETINNEWLINTNNKEYNKEPVEYQVWSDKGWTKIKYVMRHKTNKTMYRVSTPRGCIDVSEDHSLLKENGEEIRPTDLDMDTLLLHSYPSTTDLNDIDKDDKDDKDDKYDKDDKFDKERIISLKGYDWCNNLIRNSKEEPIEIYETFNERNQFMRGIISCMNFYNDIDSNDDDYYEYNQFKEISFTNKLVASSFYLLCKSLYMSVSIKYEPVYENKYDENIYEKYIIGMCPRICSTKLSKVINLGNTEQYIYDLETENHHFQAGIGELCVHNTDGFHIKGLLFNLFKCMWPTLLNHNGFMCSLLTPIIKITKGKEHKIFYNLSDYEKHELEKGWKVKYYKGLGTSTTEEGKQYFRDMKLVEYRWDEKSNMQLDLAFNGKKANERKEWLKQYDKAHILEMNESLKITYDEFVNKELIHFSMYDVERSIGSMCDGLKLSTRKILYCCFKKNLKEEIKVAQLVGYVSENAMYHHGEASLEGAIIGMAQDYVGSNNINLLMPNGQFGTRHGGGDDHASSRYIFTQLNPMTRKIFRQEDDQILSYINDEGTLVEPVYYMPIVPMVLVNGIIGIGTGYSTNVPNFNITDIINILKNKLNNIYTDDIKLVPYYKGFKGKIIQQSENKYITYGLYRRVSKNKVEILELPVGRCTNKYKEFLEEYKNNNEKMLKHYENKGTDDINFLLEFYPEKLDQIWDKFDTTFNLTSSISTTNMHLFDANNKIKLYNTPMDIINDFYEIRLKYYTMRKNAILQKLKQELVIIRERTRFIMDIIENRLEIKNIKKQTLNEYLIKEHYELKNESYEYLINMPMHNLTEEKKESLMKEKMEKEIEYNDIDKTDEKTMWLNDLSQL